MADTKIAEEDRIALLHQSTEAAWAALQASSERAQRIRGDYEVGDETVVVQGILKSAGWTIVVANQELHHEGIEKKKRVSGAGRAMRHGWCTYHSHPHHHRRRRG